MIILTHAFASGHGSPSLTCLFFQRLRDAHELLQGLVLVVDRNPVIDFQHFNDAGQLGDDLVFDLHLLVHLPEIIAGLAILRRRGSVEIAGIVAADLVRAGTVVGDVVA